MKESNQTAREATSGAALSPAAGSTHHRSGQIIESEIEAYTGAQQIANFLIRLVAPKRFIHVHQHQFRHSQAGRHGRFHR